MALDERYVLTAPITQIFLDKDSGLALSAGTLSFFEDEDHATPKNVFELTGTPGSYVFTPLGNEVTLSGTGQIQNAGNTNVALYLFPYDANNAIQLYYIECKSATGVTQFTRQAWPNLSPGSDPTQDVFPISNQIANPQFSRFFVNSGANTFTVNTATDQVFKFAPDWDFVISGTGDVTVTVTPQPGGDNIITSPPYTVDVLVPAGVTACYIRQRMKINSGLWASTSSTNEVYLNGSLVAKNNAVGSVSLSMFYLESTGPAAKQFFAATFDNLSYTRGLSTSVLIPNSINTETGDDGYVDIYISIPEGGDVSLSSAQVIPSTSSVDATNLFSYDMHSSNREQALMGDYFIPALENKPIPSILIGWDFPLNPAQFGGASQSMTTTADYMWDQTIGEVTTTTNTITADAVTGGFKMTVGATVATEACYLLQYLDGAEVKKLLGTRLSVNVNAWKTSVGSDVTMRVYLYRSGTTGTVPTLATTVGTIAATGVFTLTAANWTEISRGGLNTATTTLKAITDNTDLNDGVDYGFNNWEITDDTELGDTDKFAIVVTFSYPSASTVITVQSISLVPGDIPTRPAPQAETEVLSECERYYEKSYAAGTAVGTASTPLNELTETQGRYFNSPNWEFLGESFTINFRTPSRTATPTMAIYSPVSGTANRVRAYIRTHSSAGNDDETVTTVYSQVGLGDKRVSYASDNASAPTIASVVGNWAKHG